MSIVVARTFTVAAAAPAVIGYLIDFGHTPNWDPAMRRAIRHDTGPVVVGSRWHTETKVLGVSADLAYTLADAGPDRLVFVGHGEAATSATTLTARPVDGGTEVTYHVDLEMHGVAKLATPVMRIEFEKLGTEAAARLTAVLNRLPYPAT
ncbi:MAG TPA: SRPBCC family protein [Actinoplanes sp.]|nr:SRPBCC family protein [Actinoplanes sp.]